MALPAWLAVQFAKDARSSSGRRTLGPSAAQEPIVEREEQDHAPSHRSPSSAETAVELKVLMARVRELAPQLCTLSPDELSADENDLVGLAARLEPSVDSPAQPLHPLLPHKVRQRARASRGLLVSAMMTPTVTAKALSSGEAVQALSFACGPTASLASCSDCTASLANSRVDIVLQEEGDALLSIRSVSDDCRAKAVGGDAWVIRFESNTSVWRQVATDMHNGTYVAVVPREELRVHVVTAWVQLW